MRRREVQAALPLVQEEVYERRTGSQEDREGQGHHYEVAPELDPETVRYALAVALSVELRGVDAGSRLHPEHRYVEHEEQLVDYGHAAHGLRADLPDHDVVKQAHEVGYYVLDEYGDHDGEYPPVEFSVPEIPVHRSCLLSLMVSTT